MQTRHGSAGTRPRGVEGFTLIEILISMVILMVGLLGIMSVFPVAMRSAGRAVEDTYASAIAQSVVDAIRNGLRAGHAHYVDDTAFFVFDHDGTTLAAQNGVTQLEQDRIAGKFRNMDLDSTASYPAIASRDYCILLPKKTEVDAQGRGLAYLYPRKNTNDNQNRTTTTKVMGKDGDKLKVELTYKLGQEMGKDATLTQTTLLIEQRDPYPQYSFAFTVRPARGPDPLAPVPTIANQTVVPSLYEVAVYVYRNFSPDPMSKFNDPVREYVTFVTGAMATAVIHSDGNRYG